MLLNAFFVAMDIIKMKPREVTIEHSIPVDILDDLCSRFIINVPEEERKDVVRVCFQIELAHWFYLDFYCTNNNEDTSMKLKPCGMREFSKHVFQHIPFLKQYVKKIDDVLVSWREYKQAVPTYGAILLNQDLTQVLLVQSYWSRTSWSFPKGKVNKEEEPSHCAIREVLEETGFDISNLIDPEEYIESNVNDQTVRLYIIGGIQQGRKFKPLTRNEIKAVEWFSIADLPLNKNDMTTRAKMGIRPNAFFMVLPFVKRIKRWIAEKHQKGKIIRRQRYKSMGDFEMSTKVNITNTNNKVKKQHQLSMPLQDRGWWQLFPVCRTPEIEEYHRFYSQRSINQSFSSPTQTLSRNTRKDRKPCFKRKLIFNGQDADKNKLLGNNDTNNVLSSPQTSQQSTNFYAESWLNFKFDKLAIMKALF